MNEKKSNPLFCRVYRNCVVFLHSILAPWITFLWGDNQYYPALKKSKSWSWPRHIRLEAGHRLLKGFRRGRLGNQTGKIRGITSPPLRILLLNLSNINENGMIEILKKKLQEKILLPSANIAAKNGNDGW